MNQLAKAFLAELVADRNRPRAASGGNFLASIGRLIGDCTTGDDTSVCDAFDAWEAAGYPLGCDFDDIVAALTAEVSAMDPMARRIAAREISERFAAMADE